MASPQRELLDYVRFLRECGYLYLEEPPERPEGPDKEGASAVARYDVETKPKSDTRIGAEAEPGAEPKSDTRVEPEAESETEPKSDTKVGAEAESEAEPRGATRVELEAEHGSRPKGDSRIEYEPEAAPRVETAPEPRESPVW